MGFRSRKRRGRPVNGLLLLDKPAGLTSNAALQACKRLFFAAKAGHTGSLDPLATGVLPICFGEATKFSQYLLNAEKSYRATIVLGAVSDTEDADGQITAVANPQKLSDAEIADNVVALLGERTQIPPMYSALKHNGQRLYDLAREGVEVERDSREISVYEAKLVSIEREQSHSLLHVRCDFSVSKGTYIRSLAALLGHRLGVGGYLGQLRRTAVGQFDIAECVGQERLVAMKEQDLSESEVYDAMDALLVPVERALEHLPMLSLDENSGYYLRRGNPVLVPSSPIEGKVALKLDTGEFIGIGEIDDEGRVAPRRLVVS